MPNYIQEQLIVILTTTLSLLTAWSWNSVLQQYIDQYYGRSLSTRVLGAVVVTVITFLLINWLLNHFRLSKKELKEVAKTDLTGYVVDKINENQKTDTIEEFTPII